MTAEGPPRAEANAELKAIFWSVPDLYFRVMADGTIVDFRPGRADDLYLPPERFLGRRMSELLPEPVGRQVAEAIAATIEKRAARTVEYPLTVPSGEKTFEAHLVPYAADQAVMVVRDISDHRRALEAVHKARADLETRVVARTAALEQAMSALRESEERFRALAENSPDVIMRFDRECRHLYASAVVDGQTGIPARDFIGKTHRQLGFPEALCELWEGAITRVFTTGQMQHAEFELPTHIWIDWLLVPEFAADGSVAAVMTAARDITERKHAEEALEGRVAERTAELKAANTALQAEIAEHRRTEERLRQALAWQEEIFEGSRDAVFISDNDACFQAVNRAASELTGYSRDELLRMRIPDLHEATDLHAYEAFHDRILDGEEIVSKAKIKRKDGRKVDTEFNNRRITVGGLTYMHTSARDISSSKRAEEALRESELHFRTLAETTGTGILIVQDDRFTYANPAAERLTGYSVGELTGMTFWQIIHPDFQELVRTRAAARLVGARDLPSRYEIKVITKNGAERWFSLTSGMTSLRGKPGFVATIADITEEQRLRDVQAVLYQISEATQAAGNLDELFRSIHAIIGRLMDARNFYIALHDAASNLISFPYFVDEVDETPAPFPLGRGMTSYVLRSGQPLLATSEVIEELEARGEIESLGAPSIDWLGVPLKVRDRVIGVLAVQSYAGTLRYSEADKEVLSYVSAQVAQAIERKSAEQALRESERMRAIGQLAGGVAHDFNNLLQALLGSVEVLRARASDPQAVSRVLADVEADVKRGSALSRQLLLFARREVIKLERMDLNEVVRETSSLLLRLLRENIRFVDELAAEPLPVDVDRGQLEQVLVNFALNAADAMPEGGKLTIRSGRCGENEAFLEVQDTGAGIPEEVRARIFEPFFTTKGTEKGVGLGLAVVHGIVSQHGGRIEVASEIGAGSTFRVILPRQESGPHPTVADPIRVQAEDLGGLGERILVVEDEAAARKVIVEILTMLGYQVVGLGSGEEALALPADQPFDLLLADLLLPGITGGELAHQLRARWPEMRVIAMSGYAEDDSLRRWVSFRVMRFLQKPFGMDTLAREVREALDRG